MLVVSIEIILKNKTESLNGLLDSPYMPPPFSPPQQLYRKKPGMTMSCAKLPQNISKNRYRDISPCKYLLSLFVKVNLLA